MWNQELEYLFLLMFILFAVYANWFLLSRMLDLSFTAIYFCSVLQDLQSLFLQCLSFIVQQQSLLCRLAFPLKIAFIFLNFYILILILSLNLILILYLVNHIFIFISQNSYHFIHILSKFILDFAVIFFSQLHFISAFLQPYWSFPLCL